MRPRTIIQGILCLFLLMLSYATVAQDIVGPDGPDDPSTLEKYITVTQHENGTILPKGKDGKVTLYSGNDQKFTIASNPGYAIEQVIVDGKALLLDKGLTSYTYTFRKVSDNSHSIEATFRASRFTLTGIAGAGGCIIPATATIDEGGYQLFTFTADTGFEIDGIQIDNGTLDPALRGKTEGTYLLENIKANHAVKAIFRGKQHAVTWEASEQGNLIVKGPDGNTLSSGDKIAYGSLLTIETKPHAGYESDKLTANGIRINGHTYTITGDVTFAASFKQANYTVTVQTGSEGGLLTVKNGNTSLGNGTHTLPYGTILKLSATPRIGHELKEYSVAPTGSLKGDVVTITEDVSIQAIWKAISYPLTVASPDPADGTLLIDGITAKNGTYPYGTTLTLENAPKQGKILDCYSASPAAALSGNQLTITAATKLTARFKPIPKEEEAVDPEDGKKLFRVTFPSTLTVMNGSEAIGNNSLIKEGTLLTLMAENTEAEQLSSLTANGNPIRFQTTGYLNMGGHVLNVPTQFAATFTPNRYTIHIDTPQGGTLSATIDGVPVLSGSVYPHGSDIRITATPGQGYKLTHIWAGPQDITDSRRISLTAPLSLYAEFKRETEIGTNTDPSDPDPESPLGIDLSPQSVTYDRKEQFFTLEALPDGLMDKITIRYRQGDKYVKPVNAGVYDVYIDRPADDRYPAFSETIPAGLEIRKAPVSLTDIKYSEEQILGNQPKTTAVLQGGEAEYLGQAVEGTFTWISALAQSNRLTVTRSSIEEVRFTPKDETNYLTASAKVRIQVGTESSSTYKIKVTTEGEGSVEYLTGSLWYPKEGPFYEDIELSLKAIAGTGHRFAGFLIEGITYAQSPYTIRVSKDMEVTARFIPKEDPANPSDPTAPDALKVTIDVPSPCVYDGTPKLVGVSSTPALKGFQIKYLDKDKNAVIPVEAGTYQVIVTRPEDEIYKAYSRTVSLTVSKASPVITRLPTASVIPVGAPLEDSRLSGGEATVNGTRTIPGTFVWAEPEKTISQNTEEPVVFTPANTINYYSISDRSVPVRIIQGSEPIPVLITYGQPAGGKLIISKELDESPIPSGSLLDPGTEIRIETRPDNGMRLYQLHIGDADYTAKAIAGQYTIVRKMYTSATIKAVFTGTGTKPDPDPNPDPNPNPGTDPTPGTGTYTVWVSKTGLGTVSPETSKVRWGDNLSFTITPGSGQQIVDVRLNGNSVGAVRNYTLNNIQADASIEVVFSQPGIPVYTLRSITEGKGGAVSPTIVRVTEGSNHRFVIRKENKGQIVDVCIGDSTSLESIGKPSSYVFQNVRADSLIVATFSIPTSNQSISMEESCHISSGYGYLQVTPYRGNILLQVYKADGRLVFKNRVSEQTLIQGLQTGVYLLEIYQNGHVRKEKIAINGF